MIDTTTDAGALDTGFTASKRQILLTLKRRGRTSLGQLSGELGISKMAILKHVAALESRGLIGRSFQAEGRGRPRVYFELTHGAARIFPAAYTHLTVCALAFIEQKLGREAVVHLLRQRTQEVYDDSARRFEGLDFAGRVQELVVLREQGGYMAERGRIGRNSAEVLEHNCPILAVADRYGEACQAEVELFQRLLHADVEASHRVVSGDPVCRFLIRRRSEYAAGTP
jgi:predicted ArsR family transcriptional regulator